MGHAGAPSWPCVGVEQVVRTHHGEARVDDATLALLDLVHGGLHVVVDATPGDTAQGCKGARVGVEQHFVALAGVGHDPERTTGAELQMRYLHAPVDTADDQAFFAPVELKCFAQFKLQGYESVRRLAFASAPVADEVGDTAIATRVTIGLDLCEQILGRAPVSFGAMAVGFECLFESGMKRGEFGYFMQRQFVA